MRLVVDYEYGVANLWSSRMHSESEAVERFLHLAGECFGIRKSIGEVKVINLAKVPGFPGPYADINWVTDILSHRTCMGLLLGGDIIVWDSDGNIKGEYTESELNDLEFFPIVPGVEEAVRRTSRSTASLAGAW